MNSITEKLPEYSKLKQNRMDPFQYYEYNLLIDHRSQSRYDRKAALLLNNQ
jgi:hypothetical protein